MPEPDAGVESARRTGSLLVAALDARAFGKGVRASEQSSSGCAPGDPLSLLEPGERSGRGGI